MKVKVRNRIMLIEGNAVRHIWAEYFDELLNVQDEDVQASVVAVGGDSTMPVFGRQ